MLTVIFWLPDVANTLRQGNNNNTVTNETPQTQSDLTN